MSDLSITMPVYNEGKSILKTTHDLVKELKKNKIDYEVVLVDNGSKDNTSFYIKKLVKENRKIKMVHVKINQGYGWGIINGLEACSGKYIGWVDADGQIRPMDAVACYNFLKTNPSFDVCKGKRKEKHGKIQRIIVSHFFDLLFPILFFHYFRDINAKPKVMKKEVFKKLNLKSKNWFIDCEVLIKAVKNNYKVGHVDVEVLTRKSGKTNVRSKVLFEFIRDIIKARFNKFN